MEEYGFTAEEWASCIKVLEVLKDDPFNNPDNQTLKTLVTAVHKRAKQQVRKENQAMRRREDIAALKATAIIEQAQRQTTRYTHTETDPSTATVHAARHCYCCGTTYHELHFFYHRLCPSCAELNYANRSISCDLSGQNVVLTGGRVKIGYAAALKFLRAGANLVLTTRFPAIALGQLSAEPDYETWKDKLTVYGLDLRNLKAVNAFIAYCHETFESLEILINNAAQTIKYPEEYYRPLQAQERLLLEKATGCLVPNETPVSAIPATLSNRAWGEEHFLPLNRFGQPVDARDTNSWNALIGDVGLEELLEVNLINHISPYCLVSGLKPLMLKSAHPIRHVVNVTSSEGQFSYPNKNSFHPHTNMTKAALNMLTRTSGAEFVRDGIYMNAVDVGWISTGASEIKREKLFGELRIPPLDPVDGAARILHPICAIGEGRAAWSGIPLKDYKPANW